MGAQFVGKMVTGQAVRAAFEGDAAIAWHKKSALAGRHAYNPPASFGVPAGWFHPQVKRETGELATMRPVLPPQR
jgi:hypothetical protein